MQIDHMLHKHEQISQLFTLLYNPGNATGIKHTNFNLTDDIQKMSFEGKYNVKSPGKSFSLFLIIKNITILICISAVKRLMREAQELHEATEEYYAYPLDDNLFEWHFTIQGPPSTDFEGGVYHGRILLPPEYPMKPPNIILLTPNGRFKINKKICLSISDYHPETWQPSWSIRTALLALIAFMPTPGNGTIGSLDYSIEERQKLVKKSLDWQCENCGKVVDLLSKNIAKKPITEEEQSMLDTIALKVDDNSPETSFAQNVDNVTGSELRHRTETTFSEMQEARSSVRLNPQIETMISSNDLFWSILIALLASVIILLVLRRLFLV
ncbi:ubiquitin-conjugating enzyme E2 J1-like [Vespula squamosa]|uniref:Ubiquitin-conjugating enzyme E2 J1-like n=1 Tax=Vespula squamosa TaxID=30214 RepID=A0ABD2B7Y2_VESSQ